MLPSEEDMRTQMFKTMQAAEVAFKAITDHLTADKQPCETATEHPNYSAVRVYCERCGFQAQFKDYERDYNSPYDTCTCSVTNLHNLPPAVREVFLSHLGTQDRMGPPGPKGNQGPPGPLPDLREILNKLDRHAKALSIIGVFGGFENVSFGQTEPGSQVRALAGLVTVCRECVGTGWLARDESCKNCKNGYLKV